MELALAVAGVLIAGLVLLVLGWRRAPGEVEKRKQAERERDASAAFQAGERRWRDLSPAERRRRMRERAGPRSS